jgi:hypothetical protein
MADTSTSIKAFMVEGVCVERWKQYLLRFLLLLFAMPAIAALSELPGKSVIRLIVEGLSTAVTLSVAYWLVERHGSK